jgi:Na+-transporting methylmalonyl-CoA/oxaloacetate decarboxylase gamma subunit
MLIQSLQLMGFGLGGVFAALAILYLAIKLIAR